MHEGRARIRLVDGPLRGKRMPTLGLHDTVTIVERGLEYGYRRIGEPMPGVPETEVAYRWTFTRRGGADGT